MTQETPEHAFRLAVQHHQSGRLPEAEAGYRRALALNPDYADALQLLGALMAQTARGDEGIALIRRAISIAPNSAGYYGNLGFALASNGRKEEAVDAFRQAVALGAGQAEARVNLANALRETGRFREAVAEYREAVALRLQPAETLNNFGLALQGSGALDEAIAVYRSALATRPDAAALYINLGNALLAARRREEAEAAIRRALDLAPQDALAWYNLGNVLRALGRDEEAIDAYGRALAGRPDFAEVRHNLANALRDVRRIDEALEQYRAAFSLGFDCFELHSNLGVALKDAGELDEALSSFRRALEFRRDPVAESNLVYTLHFHPDTTRGLLRDAHARWNDRYARGLRPSSHYANDRSPDRRLRIGYVSPDFRVHPVGTFALPLLSHHDHERFEVFCYSDVRRPDAMTERLRGAADEWRITEPLSDEQLAGGIRADGIDILVDLTMHMAGSRLLAFGRKPAPVQITYLAYCSTTGLTAIDYRLSDPYLDPPGADESVYSETTVRLPRTYWCYQAPEISPAVNELPALTAGHVTFGCLNNFSKVTGPTFDCWCEILRTVPNAWLVIHADEGEHRRRALSRFAAAGIESARIEFVGFVPFADYLSRYHRVDVALDPFPYTGGTTTCDALWMGVPVVTLAGDTAVSRGGLSILSNLGHPEWVAREARQYVGLATDLAADVPRLARLRATLRERMRNSRLMDAPTFTRDVEAAYRRMWHAWCAGQ